MINNDIKDKLVNIFNKPLQENYVRRIVFWHDYKKEFESFIDELSIDNVKIIKFTGNNVFEIKKLLYRDDKTSNYLVYDPVCISNPRQNYLLDLELESEVFSADYTSTLLDELNIKDNQLIRNAIEQYSKFFNSKERKEEFSKYNARIEDTKGLHLAILGVLSGAKSSQFNNILLALFMNPKKLDNINDFGNINILWKIINLYAGYVGNNLEELENYLFFTALSTTMKPSIIEQKYPDFINKKYSSMCYNILNSWFENSSNYDFCYNLANNIAIRTNINNIFNGLVIDDMINSDIFPSIDETIVSIIYKEISSNTINTKNNLKVIESRRTTKFFKKYKNQYEGLMYLSKFVDLYQSYGTGFHHVKALEVWNEYSKTYYLFDYYYRKFHYYFKRSLENHNETLDDGFKECASYLETLYKDKFLNEVNSTWIKNAKEELENKGKVSGTISQLDFYHNFVGIDADKKITFVIISDALRYEVGHELFTVLSKNERANVTIKSMETVFPSITEFGMPALLPGNKKEIVNNEILIDGLKCNNIDYRDEVLKHYNENGVAILYQNFINLKKDERAELIKGKNVVYIYHNEIDAKGDKKITENEVFDACSEAINSLDNLVQIIVNLRSSSKIIITSDHGFIYNFKPLEAADKTSITELKGVKNYGRRFIIGSNETYSEFFAPIKMVINDNINSLIGYAPLNNVRLNVQGGGENYVHGGISLEEMMIPVIVYDNVRVDSKAYKDNSDKYNAKYAKIQLVTIDNRISNLSFRLKFYQTEKVSGTTLSANYELYVTDESNRVLSDIKQIIADKTSDDSSNRQFGLIFNLKQQAYDEKSAYYLIIKNKVTKEIITQKQLIIDIPFSSDFDF